MTVLVLALLAVTIEPSTGARPNLRRGPGGYVALSATLPQLLSAAYDTGLHLIESPDWMATPRFDVQTGGGDNWRAELRAALEEKFGITVRREPRPVLSLVLRRSRVARELIAADFTDPASRRSGTTGPGRPLVRGAWSFEDLARLLQMRWSRRVVDETGYGGYYVMDLQLTGTRWEDDARQLAAELDTQLTEEYQEAEVLIVEASHPPEVPEPAVFPCGPDTALRAAIEALPRMEDLSLSFDQRMAPRRKLLETYPTNLFALMAHQDAILDKPHLKDEWDRAVAWYRGMSDHTTGAILEARLTARLNPLAADRSLRAILRAVPKHPWANLLLGAMQGDAAASFLEQFRESCSYSLADVALYDRVADRDLLETARRDFERALERRRDDEALAAWPHLWRLRARIWDAPPKDLSETIRRDLNTLRAAGSPVALRTLCEGHRLLHETAACAALEDQVLKTQPGSQTAFEITRDRTAPEARSAAFASWQLRWPTLPQVLFEKWAAQPSADDADALLVVAANYRDIFFFEEPIALQVARLLRDRAPALVPAALRQAEAEEAYRLASELPAVRAAAAQRLEKLREQAARLSAGL